MIVLLCVVCVGIYQKSKQKDHEGVIVGNKIVELTYLEHLSACDATFLNESMTTAYILKMFEQNASKICDHRLVSLSSLLKNKTYMILQLSMYDFTQYVTINSYENKMTYDLDILSRQLETTLSMINNIINEITTINPLLTIIHIGYYYPFSIYDSQIFDLFEEANVQYKQLAAEVKQQYIDFFDQSDKNLFVESSLSRMLNG